MESVEDGQWHGDVGYDGPRPEAVEVQLDWVRLGSGLLQRVDGPHGQIADQKEGHDLPSGFLSYVLLSGDRSPAGVQDEHSLTCGFHQGSQGSD